MSSSYRVLVVEDDHALRDLVARSLRAQDFDVVTAADGESALRSLEPLPDAILLDIGLPDADGRDICQAVRGRGVDAPVIFISGRREIADRLAGFASGGDDYLAKPFALSELVARLRAVLRRHVQHPAYPATDRLLMDPVTHAVRWRTDSVDLSPIEYRLLARLLAEPGAVVRRQQLRDAAWPAGGIVADNTLDQYVTKLRRKLAELVAPHAIRVVRGVGYQVVRPG